VRAQLLDLVKGFSNQLEEQYLLRDIRVRVLQTLYDVMEPMPWEQAWDPAVVSQASGYAVNAAALAAEWRGSPEDLPVPAHGNAFCMPSTDDLTPTDKTSGPPNFPRPLNLSAVGTARLGKRLSRFDEMVVSSWRLHSGLLPTVVADVLAAIAPLEDHLHEWAVRYHDLVASCEPARATRMSKWVDPTMMYPDMAKVAVEDVLSHRTLAHLLLNPFPVPGPKWTGVLGVGAEPGREDGACMDTVVGRQLSHMESALAQWQGALAGLVPEVLQEFNRCKGRLSLTKAHVADFRAHHASVASCATSSVAVMQAYKDQAGREEGAIRKSPQLVADLPGIPTLFTEFVGPDTVLGSCIVWEMARPYRC
jgi:hypothetical protein